MRVLCRNGHYAFYPDRPSEISRFARHYGVTLVAERDYYTFDGLAGLPSYSLKGALYGGIPAIKSFGGTPWNVMGANGFVWSLALKRLVPIASQATTIFSMPSVGYYLQPRIQGLPQSGAIAGSRRVLSYDAIVEPSLIVRVLGFSS